MTDKFQVRIEHFADPEEELRALSLDIQSFGVALQRLYEDASVKEIDALDVLKQNVQQMQRRVGEQRQKLLEGGVARLSESRKKLDEQRQRLDSIAKAINSLNEIVDIATQVAQIAAGIM